MAARYWRGTTSNSWGDTNNWSDTSGGATGFSVPTASDDVIFDGNGNNPCDIDITNRACLSFTVQGTYTNTITHSQLLTVSGNITLHSGYTIAGSGAIAVNATSTITSGGKTWPNAMTWSTNHTTTLSGDFTISGVLTVTNVQTLTPTASEKLYLSGGIVLNGELKGTVVVDFTGGTLSSNGAAGTGLSVDWRLAGNVTFTSGNTFRQAVSNTTTITYVSGSITTTGSTLQWISGNGSTMNTNGMTWGTIYFSNSGTTTLTSNLSCETLLTLSTAHIFNATTSETCSVSTALTINGAISGTAKIILTGGTWSGSSNIGIANNLDLQGNVTISGTVYYHTGTLKYVSGTITTTGSTLRCSQTSFGTLDTNGMTWDKLSMTRSGGAQTLTLASNLSISGLFTSQSGSGNTINRTTAETFTIGGGMSILDTNSGTAKIILTGGTWSGLSNRFLSNPLDIQGNITVSGNVGIGGNTVTYVSGTVTTTSSTLYVSSAATTLNVSSITWNNVLVGTPGGSPSVTLTSNLNIDGLLTTVGGGSATFTKTTSERITVAGGFSIQVSTEGDCPVYMTGGTLTTLSSATELNLDNLYFDGNVTVSGTVYAIGTTITYISGTVTTTGSTLQYFAAGNLTLDTDGMSWNNITFPVSAVTCTLIINSPLSILGTLNLSSSGTRVFSGTHGFTCHTLLGNVTQAQTVTFQEGVTYTITNLFDCHASRIGSIVVFTSSHASNRANILMPNNGNNICNVLASFVRIDASGGRSICTFGGTVTDCVNVVSYTDWKSVGFASSDGQ